MVHWLHENASMLSWLGALSLAMFAATLIALPVILVRIPQDYFTAAGHLRRSQSGSGRTAGRLVWQVLKNVAGLVLIVAGLMMLVLPGQGLLTILAGALLLQYPGKVRIERWLISRRPILRGINWMRSRRGRPPLLIERSRSA
jgi:Putative transmembrane protein (PGPGW)